MRGKICFLTAAMLPMAGCNTTIEQLELRRDQMLRIERNVVALRDVAASGALAPERYDFYLGINRSLFDQIVSSFDDARIRIEASGRPIDFHLTSIRLDPRPGNPVLTVVASARDARSGIEAAVDLDAHLLIEGDPQNPEAMYLRVVATRIVPRLSWGIFDFTKAAFVRRLLALEATRLTERLPRMPLPVDSAFQIGGPAGTTAIDFPTGDGRVWGNVTYPAMQSSGRFVVRHAVFLRNGVHLFADLEGLQ